MASLRTGLAKEEVEPRVGASEVKKAFQLEPPTQPSRSEERGAGRTAESGDVCTPTPNPGLLPHLCVLNMGQLGWK